MKIILQFLYGAALENGCSPLEKKKTWTQVRISAKITYILLVLILLGNSTSFQLI